MARIGRVWRALAGFGALWWGLAGFGGWGECCRIEKNAGKMRVNLQVVVIDDDAKFMLQGKRPQCASGASLWNRLRVPRKSPGSEEGR
jgi:hypothetical protein